MSIFAIKGTKAPVYRCTFLGFCDSGGMEVDIGKVAALGMTGVRARVRMIDAHQKRGAPAGEITITSLVRSIDVELQVIVTQNSIYCYGPVREPKPKKPNILR